MSFLLLVCSDSSSQVLGSWRGGDCWAWRRLRRRQKLRSFESFKSFKSFDWSQFDNVLTMFEDGVLNPAVQGYNWSGRGAQYAVGGWHWHTRSDDIGKGVFRDFPTFPRTCIFLSLTFSSLIFFLLLFSSLTFSSDSLLWLLPSLLFLCPHCPKFDF